MSDPIEINSPLCVDRCCARCLEPVAAEDRECPSCARRFASPGDATD